MSVSDKILSESEICCQTGFYHRCLIGNRKVIGGRKMVMSKTRCLDFGKPAGNGCLKHGAGMMN
jgi:hypothetical protein